MVSRPVSGGGLGFGMKWDMGWMHDTLEFFSMDPIFRKFHHEKLTFRQMYAYSENFVLALSHDEVVHGKHSLLEKMPGDLWKKFANLRLLYGYQFALPGKKLLFMGSEFGQRREWNHDASLSWDLLDDPNHEGVRRWVADLNHLYRETPALYGYEFDWRGFEWIDCHDSENSVLSFLRRYEDQFVLTVINLTPVPREGYRIGVPQGGEYSEIFNSDSAYYGGSNVGNGGRALIAEELPWMNQPHSLSLTLRCFTETDNRLETISALHSEIDSTFRDANIVIAFPQRDLHVDIKHPLMVEMDRSRRRSGTDSPQAAG